MPIDVDLDPADPQRIALTAAEGFFVSRDSSGWCRRRRDVFTVETLLGLVDEGPASTASTRPAR